MIHSIKLCHRATRSQKSIRKFSWKTWIRWLSETIQNRSPSAAQTLHHRLKYKLNIEFDVPGGWFIIVCRWITGARGAPLWFRSSPCLPAPKPITSLWKPTCGKCPTAITQLTLQIAFLLTIIHTWKEFKYIIFPTKNYLVLGLTASSYTTMAKRCNS